MRRAAAPILILALLLSAGASARDDEPSTTPETPAGPRVSPDITEEQIDAIDGGLEWLADNQNPDGSWNRTAEGMVAVTSLSVAARIKPDEPGVHYNLGCARARAGDVASAVAALRRAVELGFADAELMASDPDLERLRDKPDFQGLLEEMRPSGD